MYENQEKMGRGGDFFTEQSKSSFFVKIFCRVEAISYIRFLRKINFQYRVKKLIIIMMSNEFIVTQAA